MQMKLFHLICFIIYIASAPLGLYALDFAEVQTLLTTDAKIEFSRVPHGSIGVDGNGTIHLVYTENGESNSPPLTKIWYHTLVDQDISEPIRVDSSNHIGGKHPCLAIDSNNTVHVAWQDYRHTTSAGNFIDNVEIYYDRKPVNDDFSENDVRISHTNAEHLGDNSYTPQVTIGTDNKIHIIWFDFTVNGENAEVYLRSHPLSGDFPDLVGIDDFRITSTESTQTFSSKWFPSLAASPNGSVYAIWGTRSGFQGSFTIEGREVKHDRTLEAVETIALEAAHILDPPRLAGDNNGNVGTIYPKYLNGIYLIFFRYRSNGQNWSEPIQISQSGFDATQPDLAFDINGHVNLVWQRDIDGIQQIQFTRFDPNQPYDSDIQALSSFQADARTPVLATDSQTGTVHIVWIEHLENGQRSIMYTKEKTTVLQEWIMY